MAEPSNIEQELQALLDREAIRELPVLYCHYVWKNDVAGIVGLFSEDGVFDAPGLGRVTGRTQLQAAYERALKGLAPKPFIHNHVVTLEAPDRATGNCYVELRALNQPEAGTITGYYDDVYVKENGRWRFRERKATLLSEALNQSLASAAGGRAQGS